MAFQIPWEIYIRSTHFPGGYSPISAIGRYHPKVKVFLSPFGQKTDMIFDHYSLKSGMDFKGTTGAYKRMKKAYFGLK